MEFDPLLGPYNTFSDWLIKHPQHEVEFRWPNRRQKDLIARPESTFEQYLHNADIKIAWGTAATGTGGITSLATSSTWVSGYEWFIVDNSSDKMLDQICQGKVTVGTSPTASTEIRIYAVGSYDGSTWPDVFDGTASGETLTSEGSRDGYAKLAAILRVDATTSNREYPFQFALAPLFGGTVLKKTALFVAQNTGANLHATAGNHTYANQPTYATSV